jgi:hypothetical protein
MKKWSKRPTIAIIGLVVAVFAGPAASADSETVCPLGSTGPCATVTPSETTGDGDCDASNGSGSVTHKVEANTGSYPVGNSSVVVENSCNSDTYDWTNVFVTVYTPLSSYPSGWVGFGWIENSAGYCWAGAWTGGRVVPSAYQDLSPVLCEVVGGPPTLPPV